MKQPTREDYELAAKAAGMDITDYELVSDDDLGMIKCNYNETGEVELIPSLWNPLHDDGDSRRLQAAINADLYLSDDGASALTTHGFEPTVLYADHKNDKCAAARHAMFWLAVEIGGGMK
jgi:hypothetical protein